ncbi:MAG: twin-arginine translocase TatA/TatE family subunit [Thermoanaerobaculaceae bacterium]|nr:twin-arginine translocase TatA/TatE family subunit [Thermoanaerobaculaceae bacterium]MDI9622599.1 twin-arginine translocase TatA/TatE family subunit [Acidobacteriota bacterium]NLH10707.1 twin-arginine translocase TatA/TatE family subunit [Holophagae bacterium]HPW54652.1 twin-arginine translocase TatA/TatE family subunit [Thermoanaerobaculaceae bacterium]
MFGSLGIPELVMIFIVALLLFGPRKLPEIGRTVGKALSEFRRASNDLKRTLEDEVAADDLRAAHRDLQRVIADPYSAEPPAAGRPDSDPDILASDSAATTTAPADEPAAAAQQATLGPESE